MSNDHTHTIETLELENRMLRERNTRLTNELAMLTDVHAVTVQQRNGAWAELNQLAERVAQRLEQSGATAQAGLIREVFIAKSHP